jgi:hypothetical protein
MAPAVLRNGESSGARKPSRAGRKRSAVTVWAESGAAVIAVNPRQAKAARKSMARLFRPIVGLGLMIKIPQPIHTLADAAFWTFR